MSEQMPSVGCWARLGAALQARTVGALWSTNRKQPTPCKQHAPEPAVSHSGDSC